MKFAQYLEDSQTPEWKRAYIDYRGLKKRITAIRRAQQGLEDNNSPTSETELNNDSNISGPRPSDVQSDARPSIDVQRPSSSFSAMPHADVLVSPAGYQEEGGTDRPRSKSTLRRRHSTHGRRSTLLQQGMASLRRYRPRSFSSRLGGLNSQPTNPMVRLPLQELLAQLSSQEASFFGVLDAQLEKVESFYTAREKELSVRTHLLHEQLSELEDHKKLVTQIHHDPDSWTSTLTTAFKLRMKKYPPLRPDHNSERNSEKDDIRPATSDMESEHGGPTLPRITTLLGVEKVRREREEKNSGRRAIPLSTDPDDYLHAKKKLKKAILEHYRVLELLHNYRVLNLTGFRKALKKFEKVTKILAQEQYIAEKIDKSALGSDASLRAMMQNMLNLYAEVFVHGDLKRATHQLRGGTHTRTHHFSTFRSGLLFGLAIPAFLSGAVNSSREETQEKIPAWDVLLYIYGIILIPILLSVLIGLNLLAWSRSRINYVFIFSLDMRTRMDYRKYYEIPIFLLATLCYAFWLSFARIGSSFISPSSWPLAWLALTVVVLLNPFPFLYRTSRYWLLRNVGRLFLSGTQRVDFADFWLGDQLCSLTFTLSNLYLLVCVYVEGFQKDWGDCRASSGRWPVAFGLAALPLFLRLVQSVKRYTDSKMVTHLINGGKYGMGIVSNFCYFLWRHQDTPHNAVFALWCLCSTIYSAYATTWDLLMDWSLLKPHAKHRFLRNELGYGHYAPMYYVAIMTNILIRFAWIFYIPKQGPSMPVRTFIVGILEMLRRWQWNFYRLENEHLGNMDQYRVTRDIPLPYVFDESSHEGVQEDE